MRFQRLDLIKYGKFSDRTLEFPAAKQDFHLIVGPNEAGKSTLRSAILDLLFGIPTRSPLGFLHALNELRLGATISNGADVLEFQRSKAQKQTLRSAQDDVLPDLSLLPFLGSADRNFFDQMFGLDHGRLVAGGNSILSAENDIGQVLFQSAAGVASLGVVRDKLIEEADSLWGVRKSASRSYFVAADQLEKANSALKGAVVRTREWTELNAKVEALQEQLALAREQLQGLQARRSHLERIRRLAPHLRALKDSEGRLGALGTVVDLPEDAAATLARAQRNLAEADLLIGLRSTEVDKALAVLERVQLDESVSGAAAEITALGELRLQYSAYAHDIERRQKEVDTLLRDVADACAQLGWQAGAPEALTARLPTLLARRGIAQLVREHSGLIQARRAAEQAEASKRAEIALLQQQLASLRTGVVKPALRAALFSARALGDTDSAVQKQQSVLAKASSVLDSALLGLGQWAHSMAELQAMQLPAPQDLSRLQLERQALEAERKAAVQQRDAQAAVVARIELEVLQFKELHRPTTLELVLQAREERNASWQAIKTRQVDLDQAAPRFEAALAHADQAADARLDNVEEAAELQSKLHQLEREKQSLAQYIGRCAERSEALAQLEARWSQQSLAASLPGMPLESVVDWLSRKDKVMAADQAHQEALHTYQWLSSQIAGNRSSLAEALRGAGLDVADADGLPALCVQAEGFIQTVDGAQGRRETLSMQGETAQALIPALQQASTDAASSLSRWNQAWVAAVEKIGLAAESDVGTVEGALELISRIEEKLGKVRQIRVERIDAMNADLEKFSAEAHRLAGLIAPELKGQPAPQIALQLSSRLALANEAQAEASRLKESLRLARAQLGQAEESRHTANASLAPLFERCGASSNSALEDAIRKSDEQRRLRLEIDAYTRNLLEDGDGLPRAQLEADIDAVDLSQLAADLASIESEHSAAILRQTTLSAEEANALSALSAIGGSDAAAVAEAERQEALSAMGDAAERYIKVFTAARLLRWSIDRYREEKQGPMLARASAIFSKLTLGSFQRLLVDFDREPMALEGQRADGKLVALSGMSDGTRDQLYLALRLAALELHLQQALPLPFVADDLFINYDDARSKAGLQALAELSEQTQVIFLSHHDHLVPSVQEVFGAQVNVVVLE